MMRKLWAPWAWLSFENDLPLDWHANVLLTIGDNGHWKSIAADVVPPPMDAQLLTGAVIPSFVNAHSHAFQRAFAGQTEHQRSPSDDFWSWREAMYGVASQITPEQLEAIASQLYVELLQGGYTQICEFHYLNHQADGGPYEDRLTMTWALARAAQAAGNGLTVLPVLYEQGGIRGEALAPNQLRFKQSAQEVWEAAQAITAKGQWLLSSGLAIHSLRAASSASIRQLLALAKDFKGPIHMHVAEQTAEVEECVKHLGRRPIQHLAQENFLDARWQLVHATHSTAQEIQAAAHCGASLVICPSTEGNLGDGLCDLSGWLKANAGLTIGSDSHVGRDALEELRWLEYGQRLSLRKRNIAADPGMAGASTAQRLLALALKGGAQAAGLSRWGLRVGARADALVVNLSQTNMLGVTRQHWLDTLVFSSPSPTWRDVMVAGQWVIERGEHPRAKQIARRFEQAMHQLYAAQQF